MCYLLIHGLLGILADRKNLNINQSNTVLSQPGVIYLAGGYRLVTGPVYTVDRLQPTQCIQQTGYSRVGWTLSVYSRPVTAETLSVYSRPVTAHSVYTVDRLKPTQCIQQTGYNRDTQCITQTGYVPPSPPQVFERRFHQVSECTTQLRCFSRSL